ncbi:MAG: HEAT repeat domain-containing protein [Pirellulales bacterium]
MLNRIESLVRSFAAARRSTATLLAAACCATALAAAVPRTASAYTPKSPEVRDMVKRAMSFLETQHHEELGGDCLIALVFVKDGKGDNHPVVAKAIKRVQAAIASNSPNQITDKGSEALYSTGLACILLCEVDPVKYRREIDYIFGYILKRQMAGGGWSYPTYATGDTSQTQYAVLSLWTAKNAGIPFPKEAPERVAGWLMRTQDPGGGYGYQGIEPTGNGRSSQNGVTLSLTAAGLGSLYIASDVLGLTAGPTSNPNSGLPPAIRLVTPENEKKKAEPATRMSIQPFQQTWAAGNRFFDSNFTIGGSFPYQLYYMYALERYMGFREMAEGSDDPEPKWYNDGVEYLRTVQQNNGAVRPGSGGITEGIDTSFAVLFLTRSTKKAIEKNVAGDGTATGGRGFKGNMANARIKDGKIIAPPEKGAIDDLASILDDPRSLDIDALAEFPEGWLSDITPEKLAPQLDRLRRLVHAEKFEVRIVAVRALGRSADYESIPALIYALTDPDVRVVRAANDGLRFIARKIEGFTLPEKYTENDRQGLVKRWKDWYRSVDPAAIFLD